MKWSIPAMSLMFVGGVVEHRVVAFVWGYEVKMNINPMQSICCCSVRDQD
jgi:hypothetical protein